MSAPTRSMKALSALASAFLPSRRLDYRRQRDPAGAVSGRHHPNPQSCPVSWRSTEARVAESAAACCCCLVSYRLIECAMEPTPHGGGSNFLSFVRTFSEFICVLPRSFTSVHVHGKLYFAFTCTAPTPHACDARTSTQTRRSLSDGPRTPQSQSATYTVRVTYTFVRYTPRRSTLQKAPTYTLHTLHTPHTLSHVALLR